jgi:hypothetical protein
MTEMQIHIFGVVGEATKLRNFWHVMLYHFFFYNKKKVRGTIRVASLSGRNRSSILFIGSGKN